MAWVGAGSGRLPLWLEGRAASYASSSPYGLYQQLVAAWLGVVPEEGEDIVRSALVRAMWAVFPGDQADVRASLLCHMLALEPPKVAPSLSRLTPEQLQTATFEAWSAIVSRLTSHGPTVLVLEDLHWADPTSLRLTETLCSLTKDAPLLLVLTRRPEPDAGVSALEAALAADLDVRLHRLELSRLGEHAERDLTRWLLGDGTPEEVLDTVSRGVEGNPLFLEERLASLLETGVLAKEETEWRVDDSGSDDVPEALERLVRSRVDRLDADPHDAIVAASVLGPEFSLRALSAVTNMSRDLAGVLSELCATGLLSEVRNDPEPTYRFRHTLIQEATYGGLVGGERRRLHARAAGGLKRPRPPGSTRSPPCSATISLWPGRTSGRRIIGVYQATRPPGLSPTTRPSGLIATPRPMRPGECRWRFAGERPHGQSRDRGPVQVAQVLWLIGRYGEAEKRSARACRSWRGTMISRPLASRSVWGR